jgi:hydroxyacylglutathione hydrolase
MTEVPQVKKLDQEAFTKAKVEGLKIIDTRTPEEFAKGFLKGTLNVTNNNSFSTWMGWYMNYEESFVLVTEENQVEDLTRKLMRIGLDNFFGFITPSQLSSFEKGNLDSYQPIDKEAVETKLDTTDVQIIDVRGASEFKNGHIEGADNLFVGKLMDNLDKVSKDKPVIVHCQGGARAAIAYSILRANGFDNVENYAGGWLDWSKSIAVNS